MRLLLHMPISALAYCDVTPLFVLQHSRVKKYCESIAFYAGHQRERAAIAQTFNRLGLGFMVSGLWLKG